MGKYMKKGKITGDVAVMEIPLGVRTRARTLALQPNPELSYLQLRNRRLEKPQFHPKQNGAGNSRTRVKSESTHSDEDRVGGIDDKFYDLGNQGSCGENCLEFDSRERRTRESTPCCLIGDTETARTPGSTTRLMSAGRMEKAIPTTPEMEDFFAGFELHQQKQFIDKYNYDIMNDLPLPGRFEWVRVDN